MSARDLLLFVARRLAIGLVICLIVSVLVFAALYVAPGTPEQAIAGRQASPAVLAEVRQAYGLDESIIVQFLDFLGRVVQLDFGRSFQTSAEIGPAFASRFAVTAQIALLGLVIALVVGVAAAVLAARNRGGVLDRALLAIGIVGASVPAYASGVLLLFVFGVQLGWLPVGGAGTAGTDRFTHLVLPALTIAIVAAAPIMRLARVAVITALEQDDVIFAKARGLSARRVLFAYTLRHAWVMIAAALNSVLIATLTASIVVEATFDINGAGSYLVGAIQKADLPVVQAGTVLLAALIVVINIVFDVLYTVADPRIDYRKVRT